MNWYVIRWGHEPLKISDPDIILAFHDEIRRSDEARYDHRFIRFFSLPRGWPAPKRRKGSATRPAPWVLVHRFEGEGFFRPCWRWSPRRPKRLDKGNEGKLASLYENPVWGCLGGNYLGRGRRLPAFIQKKYRITLAHASAKGFLGNWLSLEEATSADRPPTPEKQEGFKKNSGKSWKMKVPRFGRPTKFIFSNMAPDAGCGFRLRKKTLFCFIGQPEKCRVFCAVRVSDGKFAQSAGDRKSNGLSFFEFMKKLKRKSGRDGKKVVVITRQMPGIIMQICTRIGGKGMKEFSRSFFFRPTARNLILLNAFGSSRADCASIIGISDFGRCDHGRWKTVSKMGIWKWNPKKIMRNKLSRYV